MILLSISFFEKSAEEVEKLLVNYYEKMVGECAVGSPQRGFIKVITFLIFSFGKYFDAKQKMNLLKYSTGEYLDALGEFRGERAVRLQKTKSFTNFGIEIIESGSIQNIKAGYRIASLDGKIFETTQDVEFKIGELIKNVSGECSVEGLGGNGYLPGQIMNPVDIIPFVASVINTSITQGGSDIEDDDSYRERIRKLPESFSVAGPVGAYESIVLGVSPEIVDVHVSSPNPCEVLLQPLLRGGELPDQGVLDKILEVCNDKTVRPLTDLVTSASPLTTSYDLEVTYYVSSLFQTNIEWVKSDIEAAIDKWVLDTRSKMGKDINPDSLVDMVRVAGGKRLIIVSPGFEKVNEGTIAIVNTKIINYGGIEDEKDR